MTERLQPHTLFPDSIRTEPWKSCVGNACTCWPCRALIAQDELHEAVKLALKKLHGRRKLDFPTLPDLDTPD